MSAALIEQFDLLATSTGGIAKLRELILSLAVRGQLVPQDPNDEPASELLKKIRAEKDRLIAEGKIKRDKPLAEIGEDENPYELPAGWRWAALGQLTLLVTDGTHHTPKYIDQGVPFISVKDIDGRTVSFQDCKYISEEEHLQINARCNPEKGDILLCRIGTLGRATIVDTDQRFSLFVSVGLLKLPKPINLSSYLHLALRSPVLIEQYDTIKAGGSHTNKLNLGDIPSLCIPLPPLAEQTRIVTKVEELMALCDRLEAEQGHVARVQGHWVEAALDQLAESADADEFRRHWQHLAEHFDTLFTTPASIERLNATLLQLAVRGKLVAQDPNDEPASELLKQIRTEKDRLIAEGKIKRDKPLPPITDDEKLYTLPEGWEWVRFGDITNISSGVTLGRKTPIKKPVSLPYLRVANVQRWHLVLNELKEVVIDESEIERFQLAESDLLITEGGDWDKVGRTCVWNSQIGVCLHQNHVFKVRRLSSEWNAKWGEMYLNSADARSYFASSAKQTTNLASINMTQLKNCAFPLPPLAEQSRIVAQVEKLLTLTAELKARLSAAQTKQAHLAETLIAEVV